ncbi:MAG: InlB B-repeat-containing protein [Clostridia bacterium]|nr:InlB B-repeat-containing protein [Clostridia bacterium]
MFKQWNKKIGLAVLLLLAVTVIMSSAVAVILAENVETHQLSVTYDSSYCSVKLYVDNVDQGILASGSTVEIVQGRSVQVSVLPYSGYELNVIYEILADGTKVQKQIDAEKTGYYNAFFNAKTDLEIVCKPKTYQIVFLPEEGESMISYDFDTGTTNDASRYDGLTYTYSGDPVIIEPVKKRSAGYTFHHWEVMHKTNDGYEKLTILQPDSQKILTFASETNILAQWQETGVIYLRPHFEPNSYPVVRYDYIVTSMESPDLVRWLNQVDPYTWYAPMTTEVSGNWEEGEVSPYPGYQFAGYTTARVNICEGSAVNKVYRYFLPIQYTVTLDWNGGELLEGAVPTTHVFDTATPLPTGQRAGYHFGGWLVSVAGQTVQTISDLENLFLDAENSAYAIGNDGEDQRQITLTAIWTPKTFDIIYDLGGANPEENPSLPTVYVFNEDLTVPNPVRRGYRFLGWVINHDADLLWSPSESTPELVFIKGTHTSNIHLEAKWEALKFTIILDAHFDSYTPATPSSQVVNVTFGQPLDTSGVVVPVLPQYRFLGFYSEDGVCYINADGSSACDAWDMVGDMITLRAQWELLPPLEVNLEDYGFDFFKDVFRFPAGSYTLSLGEVTLKFEIQADGSGAPAIPETFFGQTVLLMVHTDGTVHSDYVGLLSVPARPAAPQMGVELDNKIDQYYTSLEVQMKDGVDASLYEFALYINGGETLLRPWQDSPRFDDLYQGTLYQIHVRRKATESTPSSLVGVFETNTYYTNYIDELIDALTKLKEENGNGELVSALIDGALTEIRALTPPSDTFYADAEGIFRGAKDAVPFVRRQDEKIAALRSYLKTLLSTEAYRADAMTKLSLLCDTAVNAITAATDDAQVQSIYDAAWNEMSAVKITYLKDGNLLLEAMDGLTKEHLLSVFRLEDFSTLSNSVELAIGAGKIVFDGSNMTPQELIQLLSSQDVVGAYSLRLTENGKTVTDFTGSFMLRLQIPEELREVSGLRVAYYNSVTGTLEVLHSYIEGEEIVFVATKVTDFVLLGDPIVDLTAPIAILAFVALVQMIAIVLLLVSRSKAQKAIRQNGFALPAMLLTVQFLPENSEVILLALGALVILLQIILMSLLLKSDMVHRRTIRKTKRTAPAEAESLPAMATVEISDDAAEAPAEEPAEPVADALPTAGSVFLYDDETPAEDAPAKATEPAEEEYVTDGDYYDFIEPAAATKYSLPDEEFAAYDPDVIDAEDEIYEEESADGETDPFTEDADTSAESLASEDDKDGYYGS